MKTKLTLNTLVIVVALNLLSQVQSACHMLCNCNNNVCSSCYNDFTNVSYSSVAINGTCACPQGLYSANNLCLFCSDNCKVCSSGTVCIQCFEGYTNINGTCNFKQYNTLTTWVSYQIAHDFKQLANSTYSLYGYQLLPNNASTQISQLICNTISTTPLQVITSSSSTSNVIMLRTYYGLPYHDWAHFTLQYIVLDTWANQTITVQLYNANNILTHKSYSNILRNINICGGTQPDSIDSIHQYISHTEQVLSINISIPANVKLAIYSVNLDVGTCPRGCLSCTSPTLCLQCASKYVLQNNKCICNPNTTQVVSYGCLQNCQNGYLFIPGVQRCILCSIYIRDCYTCANTSVCTQCVAHSYLSNGQCTTVCVEGYFPSTALSTISSVNSCLPCATNCSACYNSTVCTICNNSLYLQDGKCVSACGNNSYINGTTCVTQSSTCPIGCLSCNSSSCYNCTVGYWLNSCICSSICPDYTYRSSNLTCLPCSSNCYKCYSNSICSICNIEYVLRNGKCELYNSKCIAYYYYDARVSQCIACNNGCITCYRSLCYSCGDGYYLDNGQCLTVCTNQKYSLLYNNTNNTTNTTINNNNNNNICNWNNPLCKSQQSTLPNSCSACRSMDYILSLSLSTTTNNNNTSSVSQCLTYCPANTTFSPHSLLLTQNQRICSASCPANCQTCTSTTVCVRCNTGYILSAISIGSCVLACQTGYISDSIQCIACPYNCTSCDISGKCSTWQSTPSTTNCSSNCTKCVSSTQCVQCATNYYLNANNLCATVCPNNYFADKLSAQCRKCMPQCATCLSFAQCTTCIANYYLWQSICLNACPNAYYPDVQSQACLPCAANCKTCFGPSQYQCLTCYIGNYMDHTQCVTTCSVYRYADVHAQCDWCHESCLYCFGPAQFQCLQCVNNYQLYRGECFSVCPAATYLAILATKECKDCSWGCSSCQSATKCTVCFSGFYLNNGECLDVCPTGSYYSWANFTCTSCSSQHCTACTHSACYQCQTNYSLYNGTCVSQCPSSTFSLNYFYGQSCSPCPMQCVNCTSSYSCTSCQPGLILSNQQCKAECPLGQFYSYTSMSCRSCLSNCAHCTQYSCLECSQGYYYYNGVCMQQCPAGSYAVTSTYSCNTCPAGCAACTSYYQCTQCKTNYTLTNGVCGKGQNCSTNCVVCGDSSNCLVCAAGYYSVYNSTGRYCVNACPAGTYPNNDQCSACPAECKVCSSINSCSECQTNMILFNNQCIANCPPTYYSAIINSTTTCQPCVAPCLTCITTATTCTSCILANLILANNTCIPNNQCAISTFYSPAVGYCLPCVINCQLCHTPTQCDKCLPSFHISNDGQCTSNCGTGTYQHIDNSFSRCLPCKFPCLTCIYTADTCTQCYPDYPFNTTTSKCQPNCNLSPAYYYNADANQCMPCDTKCLTCTITALTCTSCAAGYLLIDNACVLQCPPGTYTVSNARECLPCSHYCQQCDTQADCQQCQPFTYYYLGSCLPQCPTGYYAASNGKCLACTKPCRQCTAGSIYDCTMCEIGYYLYNGRCIATCPDGYYSDLRSISCRTCPSSCLTCTDYSHCNSCAVGYTLNAITMQCQVVPVCPSSLPQCQNCITVSGTVKCSNCYPGYYLYNGQCIANCDAGYYQSIVSGKCQTCGSNCAQCLSLDACTQCNSNYYVLLGKCYPICPSGTLTVINPDLTPQCQIDPCAHYISGKCISCISPYLLHNNTCVNSCPSGTYKSTTSTQCQKCRTGCSQCIAVDKCTVCDTLYYYYNGKCVSVCPTGTYMYSYTDNNIVVNQCNTCPSSCLLCNSINNNTNYTCTQCSNGFYLSPSGTCVQACPASTYANPSTDKCDNCATHCVACTSISKCDVCQAGTYLVTGQCVTQCPQSYYVSAVQCIPCAQYCIQCDNITSKCTRCQQGYVLAVATGQCVWTCPANTYLSSPVQCSLCPTNCSTCVGPSQCTTCSSSYVLYNGQCLVQCPSGFYFSTVYSRCMECDSYCKQCSTASDNCTACQTGYTLSNGYCKNNCTSHTTRNSSTGQCQSCNATSINPKCAECYGFAIDQCVQCYPPYYLFNRQCVTTCPDGFYSSPPTAILAKCLPCSYQCMTCSSSSRSCTSCPWGYILYNNTCISQCPSQYYSNSNQTCSPCQYPCLQCTSATACTTCIGGYYVGPASTCVLNCSTISSANSSYYLNIAQGKCQMCPANCKQCSNSSQCTSCSAPYILHAASCVLQCPQSTYLNTISNTCQYCNISNCLSCSSGSQCTQCVAYTYMHNKQCIKQCPLNYIPINGLCTINNTNTTTCPTGYWLTLNSTVCVEYCPLGYYPNNNTCAICSNACKVCTSFTDCQLCDSNYALYNGTCVLVCPTRYVMLANACVPCATNCNKCTISLTECTQCMPSTYLFAGQCVAVCPDSYYASANVCVQCAVQCSKCVASATNCTACSNPKYSAPNCKDNSCASNQYKLQSTGACHNCDTNCLTCSGGSLYDCTSCTSPLILMNGQCRSACPSGYTYISTNNSCAQCPASCLSCTSSMQCTQCTQSSVYYNNKCIDDCSLLNSVSNNGSVSVSISSATYVSDGSTCYLCPLFCIDCLILDSASNLTQCTICMAGYILHNGNCSTACPTNYYTYSTSITYNTYIYTYNTCKQCPTNCLACTSQANSCTACTNNTYLANGKCDTVCPSATYTNKTSYKCEPCADVHCFNCTTSSTICTVCVSPYMSNNGTCTTCVAGYVYVMGSCVPCAGCAACALNTNNCTACVSPYILHAWKCVQTCPDAYYKTSSNPPSCQPCSANCTLCSQSLTNTNTSQCIQCKSSYYLNPSTKQCVQICPNGTYAASNSTCMPCLSQCMLCTSGTDCSKCNANYYLLSAACVQQCPSNYYISTATVNVTNVSTTVQYCTPCSAGCIKCNSSTNCTVCRSDYTLINGTCSEIQPCQNGQYADSNGTCRPCSTNCLQCTLDTNCIVCSPTTYQSNGQCSQSCEAYQYVVVSKLANNSISNACINCTLPCDRCSSASNCTHCTANYYVSSNNTCVADCGAKYYANTTSGQCVPCTDPNCLYCTANGCQQCKSSYYLYGYIKSNSSNGTCVTNCPSGYYSDSNAIPPSCKTCTISHCSKCNISHCNQCQANYYILNINNNSQCVSNCPTDMIAIIVNNISKCQYCMPNCKACKSQTWCTICNTNYYLYTIHTQYNNSNNNSNNSNIVYVNSTCVKQCPATYYNYIDILNTYNNTCKQCSQHCNNCISQIQCKQCILPYILYNNYCIPYKCANCTNCSYIQQICIICNNGWYLLNGQCYNICPNGYYADNNTKTCQKCMEYCLQCPNKTMCTKCIDNYNFTGILCVDQAFILYGSLSNMSGFTSNITQITSAVYLGTSIGPLIFGEMTTTYFNIQFCQFILFHAKAAGNNHQVQAFLDSLQSISLTVPGNKSNTTTQSARRLLATSLSDPMAFLATNAPIFGLMGGFVIAYLIILLFEKNIGSCCLNWPRLKFYVTQTCSYMRKRFKWIYFDFVAWISYLPFIYFALMQLKAFSFKTGLQGFSSLLAIAIIIVYPLYPFFIVYLLRQNYNHLVQQNNPLVEMSLSPFVHKVKRPQEQIPADGQAIKKYITAANLRLIYDPLKYIRKTIFVFIVALCPVPTTSLVLLIILNLVFIGYMAGFRPRVMPYLVFDFIIEGLLLFFQIFMLIYLSNGGQKITSLSIAAHAIGFITANLSLIIAIILNLIAYYHIFICLRDLYNHLKQKMSDKQKVDLKQKQIQQFENGSHFDPNNLDNYHLPDKQIEAQDHGLSKSLRGNSKVNKYNDESITEQDDSNITRNIMKDKQIFGNKLSGINSNSIMKSKGGLPQLKSSEVKKKKSKAKEQQQGTLDQFIVDKQLLGKSSKNYKANNDEQATQQDPEENYDMMKDKQLFGNKGSSAGSSMIRKSKGGLPDLKSSQIKKKKNKSGQAEQLMVDKQLMNRQSVNYKGNQDNYTDQDPNENNLDMMKDKQLFDNRNYGVQNNILLSKGGLPKLKDSEVAKKKKSTNKIDNVNKFDQNPNQETLDQLRDRDRQQATHKTKKNEKQNNFFISDQKLRPIGQNDQDYMNHSNVSGLSGEQLLIKDGVLKQKSGKFKRENLQDPSHLIVVQGVPVEVSKDKYRRKTKDLPLPKIKAAQSKLEQDVKIEQQNTQSKQKNQQDNNFDDFLQESVPNIKVQEVQSKQRNNKQQQFENEQIQQGIVVHQKSNKFRRHVPTQFQQQISQKNNKKKQKTVDQQQQDYQQIRRRNKDNMFSPNKDAAHKMMSSIDGDQFQQQKQNKYLSKEQRAASKGKGPLQIDDDASSVHSEDSVSVRKQRNSAVQRLRKLQGTLNVNQKDDQQHNSDNSVDSRASKKQKKQKRRRQKSGILKMNKKDEKQQNLDIIQL